MQNRLFITTGIILLFQNLACRGFWCERRRRCAAVGAGATGVVTCSAVQGTARGFDGKYGQNSTIPSPNTITNSLKLRPFTEVPGWLWKVAWRGHGLLLPILHSNDDAKPEDADQSLKVLWNKAVVSIDKLSPGYDNEWTFDLLPNPSRGLLRILRPFLPRLHHANIEIRTVYLNEIISNEISMHQGKSIRLVCLGGGYDPRSARLLTTLPDQVKEAWELDLPQVLASKQKMLTRLELRRKKRGESTFTYPKLRAIDLNNQTEVVDLLQEIIRPPLVKPASSNDSEQFWHTIFISEGVLIYLDDPNGLLRLCANAIKWTVSETNGSASLCFADRLANVPGGDEAAGRIELEKCGWELVDWKPKPGLARHMGVARCGRIEK